MEVWVLTLFLFFGNSDTPAVYQSEAVSLSACYKAGEIAVKGDLGKGFVQGDRIPTAVSFECSRKFTR